MEQIVFSIFFLYCAVYLMRGSCWLAYRQMLRLWNQVMGSSFSVDLARVNSQMHLSGTTITHTMNLGSLDWCEALQIPCFYPPRAISRVDD